MSAATNTASEIIRAAVYDVAIPAAKAALIAEAPWLKAPVIGAIFNFIFNKIGDKIFDALDKAVVFAIIDIETQAQRKAYDQAVAMLRAALQPLPGKVIDDAKIKKAEEEFKRRLADLVRMRP